MRTPEHPDYPVDPETGQPALEPEDLATGEHAAIDQPAAPMDQAAVLNMKARKLGYPDLSPDREVVLDDSDNEALATHRRFSQTAERGNETARISHAETYLQRLGRKEIDIRETGGIGNMTPHHREEYLDEYRTAIATIHSIKSPEKEVLLDHFGLSGQAPLRLNQIVEKHEIFPDDFEPVLESALLEFARLHFSES